VVGGCAARPHPVPLLPPPHAARRRGEGARGWGYFVREGSMAKVKLQTTPKNARKSQ